MFDCKRQIRRIYAITALSSLQFAGACWAALLAARGFSLTQIGLAETIFHLTSFLFEIPSGIIADVFGRRRSMIASQCMSAAASIAMLLSNSMDGVCIGMALSALGYNFATGAREALAFETLKQNRQEAAYERFAVNDTTIWRVGSAMATLCTGAALWMGPRAAYGVDLVLAFLGLWLALRLIRLWRGISRHGDTYTHDKNQSRCKKFSSHKVSSFTWRVALRKFLRRRTNL